MKTLVTAKGAGLGAWLDPSFINCKHFVIVDEKGKFESWEPDANAEWDIISLAKKIIALNIDVLITGLLPSEIKEMFQSKGVQVFTAEQGSILELVEKYQTLDL